MFFPPQIVLLSANSGRTHHVVTLLEEIGCKVCIVAQREEFLEELGHSGKQLGMIDLAACADDPLGFFGYLAENKECFLAPVFALLGADQHLQEEDLLAAGADEVVSLQGKQLGLVVKTTAHLKRIAVERKLTEQAAEAQILLDIATRLFSYTDLSSTLHEVTQIIASRTGVACCSVILVRPERDYGMVIASSDDPDLKNLPINLGRYPEVSKAISSASPVVIEDVKNSALLGEIHGRLSQAGIGALASIPIGEEGGMRGVISLKYAEKQMFVPESEIAFCRRVAGTLAVALANAATHQQLVNELKQVEVEKEVARRMAEEQKKLVEHEKLRTMIELAGAAAHELNQPLTSILASLSLLRRWPEDKERRERVLNTLEQEVERMAMVIKRLGSLTEYSTKEYVADARIIDLERAADMPKSED